MTPTKHVTFNVPFLYEALIKSKEHITPTMVTIKDSVDVHIASYTKDECPIAIQSTLTELNWTGEHLVKKAGVTINDIFHSTVTACTLNETLKTMAPATHCGNALSSNFFDHYCEADTDPTFKELRRNAVNAALIEGEYVDLSSLNYLSIYVDFRHAAIMKLEKRASEMVFIEGVLYLKTSEPVIEIVIYNIDKPNIAYSFGVSRSQSDPSKRKDTTYQFGLNQWNEAIKFCNHLVSAYQSEPARFEWISQALNVKLLIPEACRFNNPLTGIDN